MMTTLITVMTLILILLVTLWAVWPKLRAWIEQPKYDFLKQVRAHEDAEPPLPRKPRDPPPQK
jgi:hypothetical protein